MTDGFEILKALATLVDEFGPKVDYFVNFNRMLESKSVLDEVRPMFESSIADKYLPGFQFEDDYHAAWFLRTYGCWPYWFSDYPLKKECWDDNWVRMILVPKKHHYVAEVAWAMQAFDRNTAKFIRDFQIVLHGGDKKQINLAAQQLNIYRTLRGLPPGPVKGERHLMAMQSWKLRLLEMFSDYGLPIVDTSIMRLARNAVKYRRDRESAALPSRWRIVQVGYLGDIPNPNADDHKKWEKFTQSYFERWEWISVDGVDPPSKTELSFREPARPDLWERKWSKYKKPFRA